MSTPVAWTITARDSSAAFGVDGPGEPDPSVLLLDSRFIGGSVGRGGTAGRVRTVAVSRRCRPVGGGSAPIRGSGGAVIGGRGQQLVGMPQVDAQIGTLHTGGDH